MRRPTRPQRPALVASELIVHPPEPHCKLFFARFYRRFCVFVWFAYSCIVMLHNVRFFVCRCCRLCELNRRRRVKRFKRRLRLRLSVYTACVFTRVFATLGGFILPSAVAVALPACCRCCRRCCCLTLLPPAACLPAALPLLPLPLPPGAAAAALPPLPLLPLPACICARARFLIYARGGQGIESASAGGGVTSTYNSNKNAVVKLCLYRRWGGRN